MCLCSASAVTTTATSTEPSSTTCKGKEINELRLFVWGLGGRAVLDRWLRFYS